MKQFYRQFGKRIFDTTIAGLLLILLSPVLLATALAVRLKLGGPVLFSQLRPGLHGELFMLHKFRTMTTEKDSAGNLKSDDQRLTRFGKLLRSSSLDELPELWNVLCGRMSLVGPRPLLEQYLPLYTTHQSRRHELLPGITGLAQVSGRNGISWDEKFDHDVKYIEQCSFGMDLKIIVKTFICVFRREGIAAANQATYPAFEGAKSLPNPDSKMAA